MKVKTWMMMLLFMAAGVVNAQEAKYEIKSAIVKKASTVMGQKVESTQYFDDFGKMEAVETTVKVPGNEKHMLTFVEGDSIVSIDLDIKTVKKMKKTETLDNFLTVTDEQKEKYKYQELGEETFLDKPCKKVSFEFTDNGQTFKAVSWIWKGIPLKTETTVGGMTITDEALEIQEEADIPEEKFVIPEGFMVIE